MFLLFFHVKKSVVWGHAPERGVLVVVFRSRINSEFRIRAYERTIVIQFSQERQIHQIRSLALRRVPKENEL